MTVCVWSWHCRVPDPAVKNCNLIAICVCGVLSVPWVGLWCGCCVVSSLARAPQWWQTERVIICHSASQNRAALAAWCSLRCFCSLHQLNIHLCIKLHICWEERGLRLFSAQIEKWIINHLKNSVFKSPCCSCWKNMYLSSHHQCFPAQAVLAAVKLWAPVWRKNV